MYADFTFLDGEKGGHVSISGISGVATTTSFSCSLMYHLLETDGGQRLLGVHSSETRAVVFNLKGEDLLHLDPGNTAGINTPRPPRGGRRWESITQVYSPA